MDKVDKREFYIECKKYHLHCVQWLPDVAPVATLEIIHGVADHASRFAECGEFFAKRGYAVTAFDLPGHGKTAERKEELGNIKRADGVNLMCECANEVLKITHREYPDLPHFIMGHSFGSFIVRKFITKYGKNVSGAILLGTANTPKSLVKAGKVLVHLSTMFIGADHRCKMATKAVSAVLSKKFRKKNDPTKSWVFTDAHTVKNLQKDEYYGFVFTSSAYGVLLDTLSFAVSQKDADNIPKNLPIAIMSGADDPLGEYGKALNRLKKQYDKFGISDVSVTLFKNCRHEILAEANSKDRLQIIAEWLDKHKVK